MPPEKTGRYNVSMPSWFHDRATEHAVATGKTFAAYVRDLIREDMRSAGLDVTPPKRGRKGAK